jgi:branched-chain amino acid transport system substrate-binding protein
MKYTRLVAVVVAAGLALVTACGDDEPSSTSVDAPGTTAAPPPSGDPFTIGAICTCSGGTSAAFTTVPDTIDAWEAFINDRGGVNGHSVEVRLLDDQGDAAKSSAAAREFIDAGVIAIVANTIQSATWAADAKAAGIPVLSGWNTDPTVLSDSNFYPTGGNVISLTFGALQAAKDAGHSKIAVLYCAEAVACEAVADLVQALGAAVGGIELVYSTGVSLAQPNFVAQCVAARDAGADMIFPATDPPTFLRVAGDCAEQSYEPLFLTAGAGLARILLDDPNADGALTGQANAVLADETTPGAVTFHDALRTHAPDVLENENLTEMATNAWAALQLFAAAAEAGALAPDATGADLVDALHALDGETLDGLAPRLTFVRDVPTLISCFYVAGVTDGAFSTPAGTDPICATPEQEGALRAIQGL